MRFLFVLFCVVLCQFGQMGMPGGKKPKIKIFKTWKKYLNCPMCEELSKELLRRTKVLREQPEHKGFDWSEEAVVNLTEAICDPMEDEGEWLTFLDITSQKKKAKLVNKKELGECNRECMTLATVCEDVMDVVQYEFSSLLYKGELQRSALTQRVCYDESGFCPAKKISKKVKDFGSEEWKKGDAQQRQMQKMMKTMPGAQMYSRDDIASMTGDMEGAPKKKKRKRKEPESYLEQAQFYAEDFLDFAKESSASLFDLLAESWTTVTSSAKNFWSGKKEEL